MTDDVSAATAADSTADDDNDDDDDYVCVSSGHEQNQSLDVSALHVTNNSLFCKLHTHMSDCLIIEHICCMLMFLHIVFLCDKLDRCWSTKLIIHPSSDARPL